MARAAAAGGGEGLGILLIQRRRAAMSPGQRHCSLAAGPARSGSRLARSLHLLPLAVLQRVRNDAVSGPLPSLCAGRGTRKGRGGGWSQRGARGEEGGSDGYIPRRLPPGALSRLLQLRRGARGTEAEEEALGSARRQPTPCPARSSLPGLDLVDVQAPDGAWTVRGRPCPFAEQ